MEKPKFCSLILFLKILSTFSINANLNLSTLQTSQAEMGRKSGGQTPKGKPRSQELFKLEDVPMEWKQHRRLVRSFKYLH
jgi:hypothetical protein